MVSASTPQEQNTATGADRAPERAVPRPPAGKSRAGSRHYAVLASFVVMVVLPTLVAAWYLWARAADQYASHLGFSVRKEEMSPAIELLGGITELSGSSSSDTDILYKFLQSQDLVRRIDEMLDLRAIWSNPVADKDPVFRYDTPGTIEDLLSYWQWMVKIYYDSSSGLIDVRVLSFDPEDSRRIAQALFAEGTEMINQLSAIAREDAIRYAKADLEEAVERLKTARQVMTEFRNRTQIVD